MNDADVVANKMKHVYITDVDIVFLKQIEGSSLGYQFTGDDNNLPDNTVIEVYDGGGLGLFPTPSTTIHETLAHEIGHGIGLANDGFHGNPDSGLPYQPEYLMTAIGLGNNWLTKNDAKAYDGGR